MIAIAKPRTPFWREPSVLPGFGITMGFTLVYLGIIVLLPLAALILRAAEFSWPEFWDVITAPRAVAAYRLSFIASFIAATINISVFP
jgi:sulfate/thiosulfate transport system permease protein